MKWKSKSMQYEFFEQFVRHIIVFNNDWIHYEIIYHLLSKWKMLGSAYKIICPEYNASFFLLLRNDLTENISHWKSENWKKGKASSIRSGEGGDSLEVIFLLQTLPTTLHNGNGEIFKTLKRSLLVDRGSLSRLQQWQLIFPQMAAFC